MSKKLRWLASALLMTALVAPGAYMSPALADGVAKLEGKVDASLKVLYDKSGKARELKQEAKAILVFPEVVKAGFLLGGQYGEGALRKNDKTVGYYNTVQTSFGLQAGAQTFGYALFFMTEAGVDYLKNSDGLELGSGPSVVVWDQGAATTLTTTTGRTDIYAFTFDQKGLMGGLGLAGTKISEMEKN